MHDIFLFLKGCEWPLLEIKSLVLTYNLFFIFFKPYYSNKKKKSKMISSPHIYMHTHLNTLYHSYIYIIHALMHIYIHIPKSTLNDTETIYRHTLRSSSKCKSISQVTKERHPKTDKTAWWKRMKLPQETHNLATETKRQIHMSTQISWHTSYLE